MDSEKILSQFQKLKSKLSSSPLKCPKYRVKLLKKLYQNIKLNESEIFFALKKDLNKSEEESYMAEVGLVLAEISYMIKHCRKFSKPKK